MGRTFSSMKVTRSLSMEDLDSMSKYHGTEGRKRSTSTHLGERNEEQQAAVNRARNSRFLGIENG
jgi:hypothetical protein